MIDIKNVSKWYGAFQVLTHCTTNVKKGEVVVVCGPSGSGKSTLIKCVNALEPFQEGEIVVDGVSVGAAGSKALEVLGPRILARNFEPGFYVEHFIKDMGIALAEAEKMNLCLPGLALAKQLYEAVRAQGYGRKGTQALMLALEHVNSVTR